MAILGGLPHACQIVIHLDVLSFYIIVMHFLSHDFCGFMRNVLDPEDVFLVGGILQLPQVGTC